MSEPPVQTAAQANLTITDRELFDRLGWFTQVRWAFGVFCLVALLVGWYAVGLRLRAADGSDAMGAAVQAVLLLLLYNAVFTFLGRIVRTRQRVTRRLIEWMALGQILCDLLAISFLIHCTGGAENFFVVLILVPIVIVTELLPQRLAYATAGAAAGLLNLLAWGEQQGLLPHVAVMVVGPEAPQPVALYGNALYVLHVTAALTVTIFAMVFIASTIASRLRSREAELEEAYHRLHLVDEAKGFFMRKAGHEMRAPLSAIHSVLEAVAEAPGALSEQQRTLLGRAQRRSRAMIALVDDLRKFSRLRSPQDILNIRPVDLGEVVNHTVELLRTQAEAAGLTLSSRAQKLQLAGDEELLRELATNLVANAIQYTPRGGRIDVDLREEDGQAVLSVADTGIGISPQALRKLFEEFYRAPEAKEVFANGTGLGLAIVRRVVEIHHGSVEAAPRPQGGSLFRVCLPLRPPAPK